MASCATGHTQLKIAPPPALFSAQIRPPWACTIDWLIEIDYGKAFANRGSAYMKLKDYKHAIADFTAASQLTTTRWLLERRAEAKRLSGDETGAEEDLKRASDLPPDPAR